ncbi:Asp-tRNA(Asn)/Glu-tRNA(Gln) amidotransferase subunit GatB [Desulfurispirillum indicum]|uniref:Aspartyl/glutamyl-tRNA(Asn/Gln) amidotransferase subunit B n=1 Tax=Desulfurispirillum indicum (strain ATCC BAA-1389 / DSM 22839 / S5) TaxID=653733 RepID=E6W0H0_DESIS|nr:Asp-tRNA(Asn)/Glu-tRNA(Gln) amidotransferase subunit GatB [Desulfurispirillum indicum]ADU65222.1 glutamyl-tRNA(Gln) amidotransferase, B subunit [Desulfurispirillum indicum S5]UCZ57112.1 Asp-tRNA(Asn)/Glu-tRNA(Gln) amidotransferase subunit GatB [Desulfurispirillum indicum]
MKYETVIGLEIHAQVLSESKIFCGCSTKVGQQPNSHTCPVCLAMPGSLPVLNRKVVDYTIKTGLAINSTINKFSQFARKNYFYPDLPKGYQISQYEEPIVGEGYIMIDLPEGQTKRIGIERIHMEEDAGKSIHGSSIGKPGSSYIDLNRAGTPLMEIVSRPDMRGPEEAKAYLEKIKSILEYLEVCDCNMEEGSLRCDVNISLRPVGQEKLGTKAEIKNMNSFRNVGRAIEYEMKRQAQILDEGGSVVQETRLYDPEKNITVSMRSKEEAHDYRYFPEPDLVPVNLTDEWIDALRGTLPELPDAKKERFVQQYGIPVYDAGVLTSDKYVADYYEAAVKTHNNGKIISNWVMGDVLRVLKERKQDIREFDIPAQYIGKMVKMIDDKLISGKIAKTVFEHMCEEPKDPEIIVKEKGLVQVVDEGAIRELLQKVLDENPGPVEQYRNGEQKVMGFLVGQSMKASKGKANPELVNKLLRELLG